MSNDKEITEFDPKISLNAFNGVIFNFDLPLLSPLTLLLLCVVVVLGVVCSLELDVHGRIAEETSNGTTRRMKQTACMNSLTDWFEVSILKGRKL